MRTTQGSMLASLRAVKGFLDTNAAALGDVVNTGARKRLDDAIAALSDHVATQTGSNLAAQGATQRQYSLRQVLLRDHMSPIARIARADLPVSPAIEPLRMPLGKPTAERLAAAAYGMAKAAEPYASVFVAAGMPEDFIKQLTDAADALLASLGDRTENRGARAGATAGLKARLTEGRRIVGVLDAFVKTALHGDAALLRNWNIVKRVQKTAPGPMPLGPEPAPSPALAAPATAPALPASTATSAIPATPQTPSTPTTASPAAT